MSTDAPVTLAWYGCDLRTGGIIAELPALSPTQPLSAKLGTYTTASFDLDLAGAPRDWEAATAQGQSLLVAVDTATDTPIWPGITLTRTGGSSQTLQLGAATPERYFDSRYSGDITMVGADQADILAAALTPALSDGPPFVLDSIATGTTMDYTAADTDDRTCLSVATELMSLEGGPEWTVGVRWADAAHSGFVLPVQIRAAIGLQLDQPEATLDFPGAVTYYTLTESYEQGKGANVVQAAGEGDGASRLVSTVYSADDLIAAGWARWVYRFTPATGITDPVQLNLHAAQALALMKLGSAVWTVQATASRAPRIGWDWGLGDAVRLAVEQSPRHPKGANAVARAWSWQLDSGADQVTPILVEEDS
jgi:hypothetical protein